MLLTDLDSKEKLDALKNIPATFPFPDLFDNSYVGRKVAISNGDIIGAGFVKVTTEGILVLDPKQPKITRSMATIELIEHFKKSIKNLGLDECHVFVHDVNFQRFLRKIGFADCKGGKPMVIHF